MTLHLDAIPQGPPGLSEGRMHPPGDPQPPLVLTLSLSRTWAPPLPTCDQGPQRQTRIPKFTDEMRGWYLSLTAQIRVPRIPSKCGVVFYETLCSRVTDTLVLSQEGASLSLERRLQS